MEIPWTEIITGSSVLIASVIWQLIQKYRGSRKKLPDSNKNYNDLIEVTRWLNELTAKTPISRAIVVKIHNDGSTLKPGSAVYVTIIREVFESPLSSMKDSIKKQEVTSGYFDFMRRVLVESQFTLHIDELHDTFVKDLWTSQKVVSSVIFKVGGTKSCTFYVAGHIHEDEYTEDCLDSPEIKEVIRLARTNLINIFNDYWS